MKNPNTWAVLILIGTFAALLAPAQMGNSELMRTLQDSLHAPLFAALAIAALEYARKVWSSCSRALLYGSSFFAVITIGGLGELAQLALSSSRHAEWNDVATDAMGASLGLCLYTLLNPRWHVPEHKNSIAAVAVVLTCILSMPLLRTGAAYLQRWYQAPELVTWSSGLGLHFLSADIAHIDIRSVPQRWRTRPDEMALHIEPDTQGRWSGITLEEPIGAWSRYQALEIELINPHERPLELMLRINDDRHNQEYTDRFNSMLQFAGYTRVTRRILLSDIQHSPRQRLLQLDNIAKLMLFQNTTHGAQDLYLCGIRLVP